MTDELQEKIIWQNINSSKEKGKILNGKIIPFKQKERGSYHTTKDKLKYKYLYKDLGYDTLVKDIKGKAL